MTNKTSHRVPRYFPITLFVCVQGHCKQFKSSVCSDRRAKYGAIVLHKPKYLAHREKIWMSMISKLVANCLAC